MVAYFLRDIFKKINFFRYRFRYLFNYIIIGFFSILLEVLIVKYILIFNLPFVIKIVIGFLFGVIFGFLLNTKLNFKVPKSKNKKTFALFLTISTVAFTLNLIILLILKNKIPIDYSLLRFMIAGILFTMSYTAHRKITFNFIKKVGIAVYLNEGENISNIYSKIKYYVDFVHLDLVDKSFNSNAAEVDLSLMEKISHTWGTTKMIHVMSKNPAKWIRKLNKNVDIFILQSQTQEDTRYLIRLCKRYHKKVGLCLTFEDSVDSIIKYLPFLDFVQIMGIQGLGESGKSLAIESLDKLNQLNRLRNKYSFEIIFDGGVRSTNIWRISAKYIVSSSGILSSQDPITSFMELKTSSRYHSIEEQLREEIIGEIKSLVDSINFVVSGNIVGTFAEKRGIKGISDIDIVIITDNLDKEKYDQLILKFEDLRKRLQSRYGYRTIINPTFGPIKFNLDNLVLHLMIYDSQRHKVHCIKSPFTCFDWQRTSLFFKKHISQIYRVRGLQPNYFFSSRRSVEEYLHEIKNSQISFREYRFVGKKIIEEKKHKDMDAKHKIEFSYHVLKFLITNFLKLYYKKNRVYPFEDMLDKYFSIFPVNKEKHIPFIKKIYNLKRLQKFDNLPFLIDRLELFISDFEKQFKNYFYEGATELYFIRHARTSLNKENLFLGQRSDPDISPLKESSLSKARQFIGNVDILLSSPSRRCMQTSRLFSDKNPEIVRDLQEIDYGEVDGKDLNYLARQYPQIIERWEMGEDPRFPQGENNQDVERRVVSFIKRLKFYKKKRILVCTHNVFLRALVGTYYKVPKRKWHLLNICYLDPIRFIITKDKMLYIELTDLQREEIFKNV
jgi:ribonuclease H / adenosylcobalamin/alpha-ribazole phosphatase